MRPGQIADTRCRAGAPGASLARMAPRGEAGAEPSGDPARPGRPQPPPQEADDR